MRGWRTATTVAVVLVMAAGCGETPDAAGTAGSVGDGLTGRTFLSEEVRVDGAPRELVAGTWVSLEFRDDGQLVAGAGCNTMFADVSIGADRLAVSGVGGTEMGCEPDLHAQDQWLAEFLEGDPAWVLDGDRLVLTAGVTELVLRDREVADPDRPLAGTRWIVDGIVTSSGPDGAVASMVAGTEGAAWLLIDGESFEASSGCREIVGRVAVGEGQLAFADAVQTDPACPDELAHVDDVMLAVLTGTVDFAIQAGLLTLEHPDGVGLILRAAD